MRWPIRNQILVPFVGLLVVSVVATAVGAAWSAGRRVERRIVADLNRVVETIGNPATGRFPLSENVLLKMRGLSGAEFVALHEDGTRNATIDVPEDDLRTAVSKADPTPTATLRDRPSLVVAGERHYVVALVQPDASGEPVTLAALYPASALDQARREAMWPPIVTGVLLLGAMILTAAWLAHRTAGRIHRVREGVARIADGAFEPLATNGPDDEVRDLSTSVNRMAVRLRELQEQMARTERARVLGQLAGGLAHQLRNAATGARLALQLHRKRHADDAESLDIALRQLTLVEEQIKSLLSLGSERDQPSEPGCAGGIVDEVASLVGTTCEHEKVTFEIDADDDARSKWVDDAGGVRSALLNLVLNAIEAAGPGGDVVVALSSDGGEVVFDVLDSGPGPELGAEVFEPFVTTKPEGVGLGLALVRSVVERAGGSVTWDRDDGPTRFRARLPVHQGPVVGR